MALMVERLESGRQKLLMEVAAAAPVQDVKSSKKGTRREAEEALEKFASAKNQKKPSRQSEIKTSKMAPPKDEDDSEGGEEEEEDEDEHRNTLFSTCGDNYAHDEFWICCDVCERWFHGKCVRITPARDEHIKQYKCPACSNKRARARPFGKFIVVLDSSWERGSLQMQAVDESSCLSQDSGYGIRPSTRRPHGECRAAETKQNVECSSSTAVTGKSNGKNAKGGGSSTEGAKQDYIHVRAWRGQATNNHSLVERVRREKISERMKYLQATS